MIKKLTFFCIHKLVSFVSLYKDLLIWSECEDWASIKITDSKNQSEAKSAGVIWALTLQRNGVQPMSYNNHRLQK